MNDVGSLAISVPTRRLHHLLEMLPPLLNLKPLKHRNHRSTEPCTAQRLICLEVRQPTVWTHDDIESHAHGGANLGIDGGHLLGGGEGHLISNLIKSTAG